MKRQPLAARNLTTDKQSGTDFPSSSGEKTQERLRRRIHLLKYFDCPDDYNLYRRLSIAMRGAQAGHLILALWVITLHFTVAPFLYPQISLKLLAIMVAIFLFLGFSAWRMNKNIQYIATHEYIGRSMLERYYRQFAWRQVTGTFMAGGIFALWVGPVENVWMMVVAALALSGAAQAYAASFGSLMRMASLIIILGILPLAVKLVGWGDNIEMRVIGIVFYLLCLSNILTARWVNRSLGIGAAYEYELGKFNQTLEQEVHNRTLELKDATQAKSAFLANMSHELRSPMYAITGFCEVLSEGMAGELSGQQLEYIKDISDSGDHLLELINSILDLSKIEAGKMGLDLAPEEPEQLTEEVSALLRAQAEAAGVVISVEKAALGMAMLDRTKIRQLLINLLANAIKFSTSGNQIHVKIKRIPQSTVKDFSSLAGFNPGSLKPAELYLEWAIKDQAGGIAREQIARLFQPFEQIENDQAKRKIGTGLGLAMVKAIAELHGGTAAIRSELHVGSTFYVLIPWENAAAA